MRFEIYRETHQNEQRTSFTAVCLDRGERIPVQEYTSGTTFREYLGEIEAPDPDTAVVRFIGQQVITLAEAERRWRKSNLRQNPQNLPYRWKADDGRGTWLTTVADMQSAFGPETDEK
jgi:hypothetical protein